METDDLNIATILTKIHDQENVFVTGSAGTGKITIIRKLIDILSTNNIKYKLLASTGIAAINLHNEACTLHHYFGFKLEVKSNYKSSFRKEVNELRVIVIDEISMLKKQDIEKVDKILQHVRKNKNPFGGISVIFVGDFSQLSYVTDKYNESGKDFVFMSDLWKDIHIIKLTKIWRQENKHFIEFLQRIRVCEVNKGDMKFIENKMINEENIPESNSIIRLYPTNSEVNDYNMKMYNLVEGEERVYNIRQDEELKQDISKLEWFKKELQNLGLGNISLKVGVRVMLIKNIYREDKFYCNGLLGNIVEIHEHFVKIKFDNYDYLVHIGYINIENDDKDVCISMLPLRLGYSISIHKSQGLTIDSNIVIFTDKIFSPQQFYTAVTRVTKPELLHFCGNKEEYHKKIRCFKLVKNYYKSL